MMALFDPHRVADPYPTYAGLRAARPVWRPVERVYVLSRHEDCAAVLRDPRFGRAEGGRLGLRRLGQDAGGAEERPAVQRLSPAVARRRCANATASGSRAH